MKDDGEEARSKKLEELQRRLNADHQYARTRNLKGYTEDDVERLVDEVRAERLRETGRSAG